LLDIYWNILTMHGPINVKFPNNTSKWQMRFNSEFKGLIYLHKCGTSTVSKKIGASVVQTVNCLTNIQLSGEALVIFTVFHYV
jgi:hypothetical protein